jgi:PKD domain-containing protein
MRSFGRRQAAVLLVLGSCLLYWGCGEDNGTTPSGPVSLTCSVNPSAGVAPLLVTLSVKVTPGAALNISYGDGTSGNNPNAPHVYSAPGAYNIAVNATGASGSATCQAPVTVSGPPPGPPNLAPVGNFRVSPNPATGPAPLLVSFNMCKSTDPNGDPLNFTFEFGDGTRTSHRFCRDDHTYAAGAFVAKTCVTDGQPGHESCQTFKVTAQ